MIKDIVVNLSVNGANDVAGDYAVSVASSFKAYLAGIAFNYEPVLPDTFVDGVGAGFIDAQRAQSEKAANSAVAKFGETARKAGISSATRVIEASFGGAAGQFGQIARRYDLSIVGQSEPTRTTAEDLLIEAALLESGRPVLVVPYIQKAPLQLGHVIVCWDQRRHAARAIADAMPFLERAKSVSLVGVTNKDKKHDEPPGADIVDHMTRHGVKADVKRIVSRESDIVGAILSHVADSGADFLVMGGYGHSRLREFVLGGTTRGILAAMTVPTLMSH